MPPKSASKTPAKARNARTAGGTAPAPFLTADRISTASKEELGALAEARAFPLKSKLTSKIRDDFFAFEVERAASVSDGRGRQLKDLSMGQLRKVIEGAGGSIPALGSTEGAFRLAAAASLSKPQVQLHGPASSGDEGSESEGSSGSDHESDHSASDSDTRKGARRRSRSSVSTPTRQHTDSSKKPRGSRSSRAASESPRRSPRRLSSKSDRRSSTGNGRVDGARSARKQARSRSSRSPSAGRSRKQRSPDRERSPQRTGSHRPTRARTKSASKSRHHKRRKRSLSPEASIQCKR